MSYVAHELSSRNKLLFGLGSFLIPVLIWCAVSYLPGSGIHKSKLRIQVVLPIYRLIVVLIKIPFFLLPSLQ